MTAPKNPLMIDAKSWDRQGVMIHLCAAIASSSQSIAKILAEGKGGHNLPDYSTIMQWLCDDPKLSDIYARAKSDQADFMVDEILAIADDGENDYMQRKGENNEGWQFNGEHVQRSRLRIDARKWVAGKLRPRKYSDKPSGDDSASGIESLAEALTKLSDKLPG